MKLRGLSSTAVSACSLAILLLTTLPAAAKTPTCNGKKATKVFSDLGERYEGTPKDDVIVSLGGDDDIFGKGGNDTICLGAGVDVGDGGPGNDVIIGGGGDDYMYGGAGKDSFSGEGGLDGVDYFDAKAGVVADFTKDTAVSKGTTEKIKSVEVIWGSEHDDRLLGDNGENYLFAGGGNDVIVGKGGRDYTAGGPGNDTLDGGTGDLNNISFSESATPITADMAAGTATGEGNDSFKNFNILQGSRHDDTLLGTDGPEHILAEDGADNVQARGGDDFVYADNGDDALDGGDGLDTISYWFLARLVSVDLGKGEAVEGHPFFNQDFDTFTSFEAAVGSDYEDELIGSSGNDILDGGEGNDIIRGLDGDLDILKGGSGDDSIDGGEGTADLVSFSGSAAGVTADLGAGSATGEGADTLDAIEALEGSSLNDRLIGDGEDNHFDGLAGDDQIEGAAGFDVAYYQFASTGVTADLAQKNAIGDGNDSLTALEGLFGSPGDDDLTGDGNANVLVGDLGTDAIEGGGGSDTCVDGETTTGCENDSSDEYEKVAAFAAKQGGLKAVEKAGAEIEAFTKRNFKRNFLP